MAQNNTMKSLFEDMGSKLDRASADDAQVSQEPKLVEEIESLCMNCHENGITKLLLTKIPFFREIVIMSFDCPHCGFANSEVQPAGEIQQRGVKFVFKIDEQKDTSRQLVKSDTCVLRVEEIDLEIPPGRGQLTNIEGILSMIAQDLERKQPERKDVIPEVYEKIETIIGQLTAMSAGYNLPFTLTLDDPAGNSWIEPSTKDASAKWVRQDYNRSPAQNAALGLAAEASKGTAEAEPDNAVEMRPEYQVATQMYPEMPARPTTTNVDATATDDIIENQVYSFPASCPGCTNPCVTNMKMVNIPHFKQVVLMSTVCDHCGYRSNEVKTGGEVPERGRRITIQIENTMDMSRDILKSESCHMACPELDLSVEPGTLGGRFTTIEGLLTNVRDDLRSNIFDADASTRQGDSMMTEERTRWNAFFDRLDQAISGQIKFSIILQDPLASSYVQSFTAPEPDPQIRVEEYERTDEEEEDLGLKDMVTEGYGDKDEEMLTEEEKAKRAEM